MKTTLLGRRARVAKAYAFKPDHSCFLNQDGEIVAVFLEPREPNTPVAVLALDDGRLFTTPVDWLLLLK